MKEFPKLIKSYHIILSLFFFAVFLLSVFSVYGNVEVINDETCLECHDGIEKTLAFTPHRLRSQTNQPTSTVSCSNCHDGGAVHIEDPSVDNITNPSNLSGNKAVETCSKCHISHVELDNYGFDAHSNQQLNCAECHKVHANYTSLLFDDRADFCLRCHSEKKNNFIRRSNHPVRQGNLTCLNCHRFVKRQDNNLAFDLNRVCQDCHPEQGGPFLYEHEAMNAYSVEGGGCIECHDPHGSENDRLLKQKENQTCRQCHIEHITRNHNNLWDLVWSKLACKTCHIDTHGSFTSNLFLDPDLPAKFNGNCFNTGCHSLNK